MVGNPGAAKRRPLSRLRTRREFLRAYRQGRRLRGSTYLAYALENDSDQIRLGVTTTRKLGGAVVRNRARRMVKEALRTLPQRPEGGADLVIVVERSLLDLDQGTLRSDLRRTLEELGLLRPQP